MPIFFRNDWLNYPTAIIHTQTRNRSALDLAAKLRMMGIRNNSFFLALHDPDLAEVDVFDPNLTDGQKLKIGLEIKNNPWYYFREIAMAPALAGTNPSIVEFNRANIAMWWCFFLHIVVILTQPRQTGKSFSADHLSQYLMNFRCSNTTINLLTKDEKLRAENVARLKEIYSELPPYLQLKTKEDSNNTEQVTVLALNNYYKTHIPNANEKRAYNVGRGMRSPIFLIDEGPFQVNIFFSLPAALAAMGAAVDAAKANGEPYGVVMTTTAGKRDDKEGAYFYGLIEESAPFTENFYDAEDAEALEHMVRTNCRGRKYRTYMVFSHTQLGKDDLWLAEKLELTNAKGDDANRDFFNIWTSGTSSSPLSPKITDAIQKSLIMPLHQSISSTGGYVMRWYIEKDDIEGYMRNNDCIFGVDTSDASGGDDISIVGVDVRTGKTICAATVNETSLIVFAQWLVQILVTWSRVMMIIERKSSGITILDYLLLFLPNKGIDPFKRLFNWIVNDPLEHKERAEEMKVQMRLRSESVYARNKKYFGFATSATGQTSRTELYSGILQNAANRNAKDICDMQLGTQINGLVIRNGRIDHAPGAHDDLVIGWLLCQWVLIMGKNLVQYGIDPSTILSDAIQDTPKTPQEKFNYYMQNLVRSRINELFNLMSNESNEYLLNRYELELRQLDSQLVLQEGEHFSIDAFLNELNEKKKQVRGRIADSASANQSIARQLGYADGVTRNTRLPAGTIVM